MSVAETAIAGASEGPFDYSPLMGKSNPLAVPEFIQEMKRRGHPTDAIRKIVYENPLTFFRQSQRWQDWPGEDKTPAKRLKTVRA